MIHTGVMPCTVTAGHPISSSSMPILGGNALPYSLRTMFISPLVTVLHSPHISVAHGTQYATDLPIYQCTGSGSHMYVPATGPALNQRDGPQSFGPAAAQIQPQSNLQVPGARGLAPVDLSVSRHGCGVEQQQPIPHDYMGASNASGDLANTNAGNTMLWTGTLFLNGVCAQARATKAEAVHDPYAHSFHETSINLTSM
jgi:hypothetical protein